MTPRLGFFSQYGFYIYSGPPGHDYLGADGKWHGGCGGNYCTTADDALARLTQFGYADYVIEKEAAPFMRNNPQAEKQSSVPKVGFSTGIVTGFYICRAVRRATDAPDVAPESLPGEYLSAYGEWLPDCGHCWHKTPDDVVSVLKQFGYLDFKIGETVRPDAAATLRAFRDLQQAAANVVPATAAVTDDPFFDYGED